MGQSSSSLILSMVHPPHPPTIALWSCALVLWTIISVKNAILCRLTLSLTQYIVANQHGTNSCIEVEVEL